MRWRCKRGEDVVPTIASTLLVSVAGDVMKAQMRWILVWFCGGALVACGGGSPAGGVAGAGGNMSMGGAGGNAGAAMDASDGGGGSGDDADGGRAATPTASDLQGAWYADPTTAAVDGEDTTTHQRLRFEGDRFYRVVGKSSSYCAEVGTFEVRAEGVDFHPAGVKGLGFEPCPPGRGGIQSVRWSPSGVAFDASGTVTSYKRIRNVPKVFVTVETHSGDFLGDPQLTGANAMEKADAFCDGSAAKPDAGKYRAMVWDGVNRLGPLSIDGVLKPKTTYFQADGVRNVLTADAFGWPTYHAPLIADGRSIQYFWGGTDGCRGWTSDSDTTIGRLVDSSQPDLISVSGSCDRLTYGMVCAGEGEPIGGTPGTGGAGGGDAGVMDLQGAWRLLDQPADAGAGGPARPNERLRFDHDTYTFVFNDAGSYCGEFGTFTASSGRIRFLPNRIEGLGWCEIGDIRESALAHDGGTITLTAANGHQIRYGRADPVAKIFLTLETHDGDFAHDPNLPGGNAIARADAFCNRSIGRPDDQTYKATVVDGVNRSVSPLVDWVLKQQTRYFQASGVLPMFVSDQQSRFDPGTLFTNRYLSTFDRIEYMWSGLAPNFTVSANTCQGWSTRASGVLGGGADVRSTFFGAVVMGCSSHDARLICVSQ